MLHKHAWQISGTCTLRTAVYRRVHACVACMLPAELLAQAGDTTSSLALMLLKMLINYCNSIVPLALF